jgi:hypothetical protein
MVLTICLSTGNCRPCLPEIILDDSIQHHPGIGCTSMLKLAIGVSLANGLGFIPLKDDTRGTSLPDIVREFAGRIVPRSYAFQLLVDLIGDRGREEVVDRGRHADKESSRYRVII